MVWGWGWGGAEFSVPLPQVKNACVKNHSASKKSNHARDLAPAGGYSRLQQMLKCKMLLSVHAGWGGVRKTSLSVVSPLELMIEISSTSPSGHIFA